MNEPGPTPQRSRRLTGRHWLIILLLVFTLLPLTIRGAIAWRYHAELDAWAEAGMPLDLDQLWEERTADDPGAIKIYREAFDRYKRARQAWTMQNSIGSSQPAGDAREERRRQLAALAGRTLDLLPSPGQPMDPDARHVIDRLLATYSRPIALAHQGAAAGGATRMPRDRADFDETVITYLSEAQWLVVLLGYEAALHARSGDREAAIDSLKVAAHLPAMLRDELSGVEGIVQDRAVHTWARAVEDVLTQIELDEDALDRLSDAATRTAPRERVSLDSLRGDAAAMIDATTWEMYQQSPLVQRYPQDDIAEALARWTGWRQLNQAYLLRRAREAARPLAIEDEPERLAAVQDYDAQPIPGWAGEAQNIGWRVEPFVLSRYRANARLRALRAALAAYRFHLAHGRPPSELDALVPDFLDAVPLDPFTGEPLRYRVLDDGFVVYSVNEDLTDDDGQPAAEEAEGDVAFRVRLHD